jgi:hypothetical protein
MRTARVETVREPVREQTVGTIKYSGGPPAFPPVAGRSSKAQSAADWGTNAPLGTLKHYSDVLDGLEALRKQALDSGIESLLLDDLLEAAHTEACAALCYGQEYANIERAQRGL